MSTASARTWRLEPGGAAIASAAADAIAAENLHYRGRNEIDAARLVEIFDGGPGAEDSWERDVIVARMGVSVAGIAWVTARGGALGIDPAHDRPGLRGELLAWIEHREAERRVREFVVTVPGAIAPTVAALDRAGYAVARSYVEMAVDLAPVTGTPDDAGAPAPRRLPDGHRLVPIDPRLDARRLHTLDAAAFGSRPDYVPQSLEEFRRHHLAAGRWSPAWSRLVEAPDGRAAGFVLGAARPGRGAGYIDLLAVDPAHHRRGLGRILLEAAFAAMRRDGRSRAELHVASDNPGAMALYRTVGMTESDRLDHYTRPR